MRRKPRGPQPRPGGGPQLDSMRALRGLRPEQHPQHTPCRKRGGSRTIPAAPRDRTQYETNHKPIRHGKTQNSPAGRRRLLGARNRPAKRGADRGGARPLEIRGLSDRPPPSRLALHDAGRAPHPARQKRLLADGRRPPHRIRIRPDPHPRHPGRGRQAAGLPRHDGDSLLVVLDDLVGGDLRQDHHQTDPGGRFDSLGARQVPHPRRSGRPCPRSGGDRRRARPAALREAQRQRLFVRRDESPHRR